MCTLPLPQPQLSKSVRSDSETVIMRPLRQRGRSGPPRLDNPSPSRRGTLVLPENEVIRLSVVEGTHPGAVYDLSRPLMTIGRMGGGADIEIDDTEISRVHCSIEVRRDEIMVQDLRSTNGTFLDDARILSARLAPCSRIRVGRTILCVDRSPI
jgi:hypothetical protein